MIQMILKQLRIEKLKEKFKKKVDLLNILQLNNSIDLIDKLLSNVSKIYELKN